MTINLDKFRGKLEDELKTVEKGLADVGRRNPDNPDDWEAVPEEKDSSTADPNIISDSIDDYEDNFAIVGTLERRYQEIKKALKRMGDGTYGVCEVGGEEISEERLEANPSATTCKEHME